MGVNKYFQKCWLQVELGNSSQETGVMRKLSLTHRNVSPMPLVGCINCLKYFYMFDMQVPA